MRAIGSGQMKQGRLSNRATRIHVAAFGNNSEKSLTVACLNGALHGLILAQFVTRPFAMGKLLLSRAFPIFLRFFHGADLIR